MVIISTNYFICYISCLQILQLEKRLQDQFQVRHALENALGYRSSSHDKTTETLVPKVINISQTQM